MTNENTFSGGAVTAADNELKREKNQARRTVDDLKTAGASMAQEYRDKAEEAWDSAKTQARSLLDDGEDYVRDNPTKTVLTALGVGIALGLILRR